ncbi:DUF402 domain-containing protein, partial [Candidatus Bathyarchaeota archaeon]|nr:DUF402 domain-containing protein [Candidatus Bathyarchaeota archaeon]
SKKILEEEATKLAEKAKTLEKLSASKDAPSLLLEASYFMDIEFPSASKKKLDELRGYVTATIEGHHFYKSCGGRVSATLEMAERLLEKGECASEVKEMFRRQVEPEFPEEGSIVDVKHVKLSGSVFNLGKATIESLDADRLTYSRTIKCDGIYDGLNVPKEAGDKAVSETILGEDYIITKYLSKDGVLKGAYVNLNTPVEIYPNAIRYVDLEVDVCLLPDGSKKILEVNKLEGALNRGLISKQLFEKTLKKAKRILEDIEIIS